jgi:conserved oligomeric Golgi complex subunit 4
MRDMLSYTKERLDSPDLSSNVAVCKACPPLSRLLQISKLLSVDDLDDVVDLISSSKRKGNWDLKLDDAKAFLSMRVEFESRKINELLQVDDD